MARYEDDDYQEADEARYERPTRNRRDSADAQSREELLRRKLRERTESYRSNDNDAEDEEDEDAEYAAPPMPSRRARQRVEYVAPYPVYDAPVLYPPRGGCATTILYIVIGVLATVLVGILVLPRLLETFASNVPASLAQAVASPTPQVVDRGGTIQQIRNLNRLETQSVQVERVIEAGIRGNALQDVLFGDRLLLIASGNVVAGVDMSRLRAADIDISSDGKRITISLPPSEVFSASLDNSRTRVYDRQRGFLAVQDKDLETRARQEAESEILKAACEVQVTQKAAEEAKRSMEQLLRLMQFESVTVNAPIGPCTAPSAATTDPVPTP